MGDSSGVRHLSGSRPRVATTPHPWTWGLPFRNRPTRATFRRSPGVSATPSATRPAVFPGHGAAPQRDSDPRTTRAGLLADTEPPRPRGEPGRAVSRDLHGLSLPSRGTAGAGPSGRRYAPRGGLVETVRSEPPTPRWPGGRLASYLRETRRGRRCSRGFGLLRFGRRRRWYSRSRCCASWVPQPLRFHRRGPTHRFRPANRPE